jgi:hypothetical protein
MNKNVALAAARFRMRARVVDRRAGRQVQGDACADTTAEVRRQSPSVVHLATLCRVKGPLHAWVDPTHAPIYIWRFPSASSDEEVVEALAARERWAKQARHPCAWVVDLRELLRVPPHQRKLFAEHLKRFEAHDVKYNRGSAIVLSNAWLRGIVTTIFAVTQPKFPNRTFATIEDGLRWAQEQMRANPTGHDVR